MARPGPRSCRRRRARRKRLGEAGIGDAGTRSYGRVARRLRTLRRLRGRRARFRDVGTAFNVALMEDEARLTVMHGVVEASNADRRVLVYPNAGLTVTSRGLGRVEYIDARVAAAWVGRRLILNNVILAEVLRRIAPYHRGRIVLLDGEAGGGQISAAINLDQTDEWLDGLAQTRGIRLTRIAGVTFLS